MESFFYLNNVVYLQKKGGYNYGKIYKRRILARQATKRRFVEIDSKKNWNFSQGNHRLCGAGVYIRKYRRAVTNRAQEIRQTSF